MWTKFSAENHFLLMAHNVGLHLAMHQTIGLTDY